MSRESIYVRAPVRASNTAVRCTNMAATRILYLREDAVLQKKHVLNQVIAALRRSIGLPDRFVTVWKNRTGHTHNYCNPMVYAHRGLINSSQDNRRTLEAIQTRSEHHTMNLDCSLQISPVWSTLLNDLLLP